MTANVSKTMRRAFTLIELLIAMAMVGIVALSLFASLGIAFKSRAAAERSVEPSARSAWRWI